MKTELIPKSRAKTAYVLLSEVRALALEEPKRMRMSCWGGVVGNAETLPESHRPACGTVGCIGGWVNVLSPKSRRNGASSILGLNSDQTDELFYGDLCTDDDQGTMKHARRVGALIRKFQKKYRAQLLAKKV